MCALVCVCLVVRKMSWDLESEDPTLEAFLGVCASSAVSVTDLIACATITSLK